MSSHTILTAHGCGGVIPQRALGPKDVTLSTVPSKPFPVSLSSTPFLRLIEGTSPNSRVSRFMHNRIKYFGGKMKTFNILLLTFRNQIAFFSKMYKISIKYLVC